MLRVLFINLSPDMSIPNRSCTPNAGALKSQRLSVDNKVNRSSRQTDFKTTFGVATSFELAFKKTCSSQHPLKLEGHGQADLNPFHSASMPTPLYET